MLLKKNDLKKKKKKEIAAICLFAIRTSLFLKCVIVTSDNVNHMPTLTGVKTVVQSLSQSSRTIVFREATRRDKD